MRNMVCRCVLEALLSSSLPAEHLALTRTVIRLLRFRTATLPDFLDTVCWGTPRHFEVTRAGEHLKSLPSRAALLEHQMVIRSYCAPFYRPDSQELQGLAPSFEDNESSAVPERPVEIRVWYLRGALDDEMGIIRALKEPYPGFKVLGCARGVADSCEFLANSC